MLNIASKNILFLIVLFQDTFSNFSKLAKLPKDIFKSELFNKFFIRDNHQNYNINFQEEKNYFIRDDKCDIQDFTENKKENEEMKTFENILRDKEKNDCDNESLSNNSKKNVTISVASVFNQKQKENFHIKNINGNLKSNEYISQKNILFSNQTQNHNIQQFNLQTFQPISNREASSPTCESPSPLNSQFPSQSINPSQSLNNSRCSSPWMLMPSSPLLINSYQHQGNISIQNSNTNQKQVSNQNTLKESKQGITYHDEVILFK